MKRIIIGVVAIIAIAGGAGYYYLDQMKKKIGVATVPPIINKIENALGTPDLMALAHFNYDYAKHVDNIVFGPKQPSKLLSPSPDMHPFIAALMDSGIDIRKQISHVVAAYHVNTKGSARTVVLTGKFNREDITDILETHYIVDKAPIGAGVLSVTYNDPDICTEPKPVYVQISKNTIIVSDPSHFASFYNRLHSKTTLKTARIANWPAFRDGKVFSAAVFKPNQAVKQSALSPILSKKPNSMLSQVDTIYLGGALEIIYPRGLNLSAHISTKSPEASAQFSKTLQQRLASFNQNYQEITPTLTELSQLISVENMAGQTLLKASLNEDTMPLLAALPKELLSYATAQIGLSSPDLGQTVTETTISPDRLPKFLANLDKDSLPEFSDPSNFFRANSTTGPFAVKLSAASWTTLKTHDAVELTIDVKSSYLPNISPERMHNTAKSAVAFLHIQDILDHDGYSILFPDPCGTNRYDKAIALQHQSMPYVEGDLQKEGHYLQGTKTIRLDKNANIKNVAQIFGFIELNLPTKTKTQRIALPINNKKITFKDGNAILKDTDGNTLNYHLEGTFSNLLDIRALNQNDQYLAEQSAVSTSALTRNAKSISKTFAGKIHQLELVTTEETEMIKYPFILKSFFDKFQSNAHGQQTTQKVKEGTVLMHTRSVAQMQFKNLCKNKQEYAFKFGALCVNKLEKRGTVGVAGDFEFFVEDSPSLNRNISAYELSLTHLFAKMKDGSVKEIPFISNTLMDLRQRSAGKRNIQYTNSTTFGGWRDYPAFIDAVDIIGVRGYLNNHFPHRITKKRLPAFKVGHNILTAKGLSLTIDKIENGRISLQALGNVSTLVQIVPITLDGKALKAQNLTIKDNDDGKTKTISFTVNALPIYLDIYHASSQDLRQQPIYFRTDGVAVDMSIFTEKIQNAYQESEFDKMLKDGKADIMSDVTEVVAIPVDDADPTTPVDKIEIETTPTLENEIELNRSLGLD